jgi:oligoribonuclease
MIVDKEIKLTKLLWVDLEMTGLDPERDVIIEIAAEVTDFNFKTLASYEARIKHDKTKLVKLFKSNNWYRDQFPENRDDFLNKLDQAKELRLVEDELTKLLDSQFGSEPAVLAGNSIHNDRAFIKQYLPAFDMKLHYRMLDVSSWKVVMNTKFGVVFEKNSTHRAFDDIQASIAELQYYLDWFKSVGASANAE